ncbi:MAG: class I SAM-dependent methyltransferase [Cyanobacteria bacterium J06649_11]
MLSSLKEAYQCALFQPSYLSIIVNPFYFARKGLYQAIRDFSKNISGRILDVGCGNKPYQHLFSNSDYVGLEIDSPNNRKQKQADYFYEGKVFPFEDSSFSTVVCNQVLEHIFEPKNLLTEINRCLQPGGTLLISVPFVWDEHEIPQDYARYSSFGLRHLLEEANFQIVSHQKSVSDIRVVFQLLAAYIYKTYISNKNRFFSIFLTALLICPVNLIGEILGIILPKNEALYLDNIILAKTL